MMSFMDDYIDKYAAKVKGSENEKVALHFKEIIPKTAHIDENIFDEIIECLKRGIENDEKKDFKEAFSKVCPNYLLRGDIIKAKLPVILTRIILNETNFIEGVARNRSINPGLEGPLNSIIKREDIINAVTSKDREEIEKTLGNSYLHVKKVVFATFDEYDLNVEPLLNTGIKEIINLLALNCSSFDEDEPLTAVSIRYSNKDDVPKRYPVFPDAGWYTRFYPSDENDKYGRTKPLKDTLKGMPEIVHENLKLADVIEGIRFLKE
jgi:hypothetical protein